MLRLLAGIGIGGEWGIGATLIAEEWPEERRTMGAGMMHTGYYFGFFLAALANYLVGSRYGWRWMFVVGGLPALLVMLIRKGMTEPARWEAKHAEPGEKATMRRAFAEIFSPRYRLRTLLNLMYQLVSTIGLWAGSVYVPAAITILAVQAGRSPFQSARLASYGTGILSIGTILGALSVPGIANRLGRRANQAIFYSLMGLIIIVTFGYVFYLQAGRAAMVFRLSLFSGDWRSELHRVFFLAPGAVRNRMPGQRPGVRAKCWTLRRGRSHVSGGARRAPLSDAGHSCGDDGCSFCRWPVAASLWRGDERQASAGMITGRW